MNPALKSRRVRALAPFAAAAAALSLVAAGCGGGDDSGEPAGASAAQVASFVPASAPVYVEVSTDFDGPQWTQIDALAKRFPAYPQARQQLDAALMEGDVDFNTQVKPLLGDRAAFAVISAGGGAAAAQATTTGTTPDLGAIRSAAKEGEYIAVVELAEGKEGDAEALIAREADGPPTTVDGVKVYRNDDSVIAVVPGAILASDDPADIKAAVDARAAGGDRTLAGNARYTDTIDALPEQTFASSYVDIGGLVQQQAATNPQVQAQAQALEMVKDTRLAAAAAAEPGGIRVKGVVVGGPEDAPDTAFSPALTRNVPGDAIAYFGFRNLQGQVENGVRQFSQSGGQDLLAQVQPLAAQLPSLLGVTLDDLRALTAREHAVVVAQGTPAPGAVLALEVEDGARAGRTLDALRQRAPGLVAQFRPGTQLPEWRQIDLEGGVKGWDLPINATGGVTYGVDGNLAIVGSNPQAVRAVQRPVQPLAQTPAFTEATAGMPDQVTSVTWVNVGEAVRLADGLGAFRDNPEALANLRKVTSISGWTTGGDEQTFEIFVRIAE
ncbi:MAG TPA: DUF3352 domain-containing protein [Miltoncostaeaceae bacterium]|nr:DUF3352 domain-containing protein [Miltoncostaeaceae bacterium]